LSEVGIAEAHVAGELLKENDVLPDVVFTSVLTRSIQTTNIVLGELKREWLPTIRDWRLNERHYGALQGRDKAEMAALHGEAQVKIWRRSFDVAPPPLPETEKIDECYAALNIDAALLPRSESLKDCATRVKAVWSEAIEPALRSGKRVLVSAHGNSLRALVMTLDGMTEAEIAELNIPTAAPLIYELDEELRPIRHYYLGDAEAIAAKVAAVAAQGSAIAVKAQ
jgi:2,3-bisphosphoglycerate-dependent phosphoglycerate mutase